jgi:vancomycin resistance protein YoaR
MKIGKLRIRPTRRGWVILAILALLASSYSADAVASVGRVRSGVEAGTLKLGGMSHDEARKALEERAQDLVSQPVELFADTHRITVAPNEVGFRPDAEATLADAEGVGRRGNMIVRMWHRVRALFASTDVGWASTHDAKAAKLLVTDFATRVDTEGHEAGIEARGTTMVPVGAVPGRRLDHDNAIDTIVQGLESWPRHAMELPISVRSRRTTIEDARDAAKTANEWVRAPITLEGPDGSRHFLGREELAKMIDAVPRKRGLDWDLQVRFSPDRVTSAVSDEMAPFEQEAKDASFAANGTAASVVAGQAGRKFDAKKTAAALASAASKDEDRVAKAQFTDVEPELTTEEARDLNITELVSSFTTHHPCCQPRVANIHKIAEAVNNTIVKPGGTFSLNNHVGQRTTEKGYVLAPMIFDGEFRDDVGGGVSQFATTMFNAIFFGGYRLETYKAHSYYISRYPAGREATISWPRPDLAFTNNSSSGILIRTGYSGTSISVSFYGDKEGKTVTAEAGERTNPTQPEDKREANPDLPPGAERVKQEGAPGFDIVVTRIITKDGESTSQRFFTRYKAQPRIVEVGPGQPSPSPTPGASGSPPPRATGEPRQPATPPPVATPPP